MKLKVEKSELRKLRNLMARQAKSARTRLSDFTKEMPTDWNPYAVPNPKSELKTFTEDSAWWLIEDVLLSDLEVGPMMQTVELDKPPGAMGIAILIDIDHPDAYLYVKVQMAASGKVVGRSFHLSEKGKEQWETT